MNYINEDNFKNIAPEKLLDSKRYAEVEDMVVSIMAAQDADYARDFALAFNEKLQNIAKQIDVVLLTRYLKLLKALQLSGLRAMSDLEKEDFFKERVLDLFALDFVNVKGEVETIFKAYFDSPEIIEEWRKLFLGAFEKNIEKMGSKPIQIFVGGAEKLVPQNMQNWISDYNASQHVDPKMQKRSGFDLVNYLDHSKNVGLLAKEERAKLQKILQFYDWLRFDPLHYDFSLPGQTPEKDELVNVQKIEDVISPELVAALQKMRDGRALAEQSGQYMNIQKFRLPESPVQKSTANNSASQNVRPIQKPFAQPPAVPSVRPPVAPPTIKKLEEPRTLMDIKADIENKKRKAQEEIDRKLDELKRKVGK